MAKQAKAILEDDEITVVADRGYYSGEEIKACAETGIETHVAKPQTSSNQARGYFGKRDFKYRPDTGHSTPRYAHASPDNQTHT